MKYQYQISIPKICILYICYLYIYIYICVCVCGYIIIKIEREAKLETLNGIAIFIEPHCTDLLLDTPKLSSIFENGNKGNTSISIIMIVIMFSYKATSNEISPDLIRSNNYAALLLNRWFRLAFINSFLYQFYFHEFIWIIFFWSFRFRFFFFVLFLVKSFWIFLFFFFPFPFVFVWLDRFDQMPISRKGRRDVDLLLLLAMAVRDWIDPASKVGRISFSSSPGCTFIGLFQLRPSGFQRLPRESCRMLGDASEPRRSRGGAEEEQ